VTIEQSFGRAVRRLRNERGLSQEALALASRLDRVFISRIECGKKMPTLATIFQLAQGLNVSMERILREVESFRPLSEDRPEGRDPGGRAAVALDAAAMDDLVARYGLAGGETVLIVEDDPITREYVTRLLKRVGYQVLTAADGLEAVSLYANRRHRIGLIIMDVVLPRGNGFEVASTIRAAHPDAKILFVSGYENARQALPDGDAHFLLKPFDPLDICNKVRECLEP
jgi:CheY-like chemotaxis protein/DNA-binding XRE family transcriptional regulator